MKKTLFRFAELSATNLYEILKLRNEIFVLEQRSLYIDTDGHDYKALHYTYSIGNQVVAYSRILPPDTVYTMASIGRVCVHKDCRGKGLGRLLFDESLQILAQSFGIQPIKIQAQLYLIQFYESFGFTAVSEPYDDCGILHVDMIKV